MSHISDTAISTGPNARDLSLRANDGTTIKNLENETTAKLLQSQPCDNNTDSIKSQAKKDFIFKSMDTDNPYIPHESRQTLDMSKVSKHQWDKSQIA